MPTMPLPAPVIPRALTLYDQAGNPVNVIAQMDGTYSLAVTDPSAEDRLKSIEDLLRLILLTLDPKANVPTRLRQGVR